LFHGLREQFRLGRNLLRPGGVNNVNAMLTLQGFAYDNSGAGILAGDTGAVVPEPATWTLLAGPWRDSPPLLFAAVARCLAWRLTNRLEPAG